MAHGAETGGGEPAPGRSARFVPRMPATVRGRLFLFALALLIPAVLAACILVWDVFRSHRVETERQMIGTARALSLGVDRDVSRAKALAQALAQSPYLESGDLKAFERQARATVTDPDMWVVLADSSGAQDVNTLLPPGVHPPNVRGPAFDALWRDLLGRGERVSDLFTGRVARASALSIDHLVRRGGKPSYMLSVLMRPGVVRRVLNEQGLPQGWISSVVDRQGHVIARLPYDATIEGTTASPAIRKRLAATPSGAFETTTRAGVRVISTYSRSAATGWSVFVVMPEGELNALLWRSLGLAAALGVGLVLLGAVLSLWFARGVVRPVEALAASALQLGRGERISVRRFGVEEADAVAEAMQSASVQLAERTHELERLNETLEARVEDATERLVQAQKLEAVGRLTGGVAHDFNNLLTAVIGNLDLLGRRLTEAKLQQFVANAREAAERGARLTAQLLAFSRQQRLKPEPVDVNAVIEGMTALLGSTLGGSVRVETTLADVPPVALADRTQLELIILNLAINARDAMEGGGRLFIDTAVTEVRRAPRASSDPAPGHYVRVRVRDEGAGMTPAVLAQVFEPFFTTKGPGKGSGLGLSQVLGVVQQLGGGVVIRSEAGQGATVEVYLPSAEPTAPGVRPAVRAPAGVELRGRRILVVDDDAQVREMTAALLAEEGAEVATAESAEDALALVEAGLGFDFAVVDYAMPGLNGVELAERLRAAAPSAPCVLMTGFADAATLANQWSGPVVQKPFAPEDLTAALGALLR